MLRRRLFAVVCGTLGLAAPQVAPAQGGFHLEPEVAATTATAPVTYPQLHIGGFFDYDFSAVRPEGGGTHTAFDEGQFVLHFNAALARRVDFFAEISLTAQSSGGFREAVERAILSYRRSDLLRLSVGRYHTPINWWNTAFHHGQWLQTTVARPEMTKFGGKFIPVHFEGVLVEGVTPAGGWNLGYKAGAGNGRAASVSGAGEGGDVNDDKAWLVHLDARPDRLYDLQFGGAYYDDRITLDTAPSDFHEQIASAFVVWTKETPEVIAELAEVRHEDLALGTVYRSHAGYLQVAYRLPVLDHRLKPYARYENVDTAGSDPVYAGVPDLKRSIVGLRWDVFDLVAVKGELRRDRFASQGDVDGFFGQVAFAF